MKKDNFVKVYNKEIKRRKKARVRRERLWRNENRLSKILSKWKRIKYWFRYQKKNFFAVILFVFMIVLLFFSAASLESDSQSTPVSDSQNTPVEVEVQELEELVQELEELERELNSL